MPNRKYLILQQKICNAYNRKYLCLQQKIFNAYNKKYLMPTIKNM